jgi:conjugative relaxase-like TrwC/TraI family protein
MLSISPPMKGVAGAVDYYLNFTKEDYYANTSEAPGCWLGGGAELLELKGEVKREPFAYLLDGFSPDGKRELVQNAGTSQREKRGRQNGWDLTFSAPKSVSVVWAIASEPYRRAIEQAHFRAVQAAINYLEEAAAVSRRGEQGKIKERVAIVGAAFMHGSSRDQDMQLHTHVVMANVGVREDLTTGALHSINFFRAKVAAGAVYQAQFARELRELNLRIEADKVSFKVKGVPQELCDFCSKRGNAIKAEMKKTGLTGQKEAKNIAYKTRKEKAHVEKQVLFGGWRQVCEAHGFGREQADKLFRREQVYASTRQEFPEALKQSIAQVFPEKQTRSRLASVAARVAIEHGVGAEELKRAMAETKLAPEKSLLHVEWRKAFPKAPKLNPASKLKVPYVAVGQKKHKWDEIRWRKGLLVVELRIQDRKLFSRAPAWNPASELKIPLPRLKLKGGGKEKTNEVISTTKVLFGLVQVVKKELFPHAPAWSPAKKLSVLALKFRRQAPESTRPTQSDDHGHYHSV